MARYLVRARPKPGKLLRLRRRLDSGEIRMMRPFGEALECSLKNARRASDGFAAWEEEDHCSPPLAQERKAVLNEYFRDFQVEPIHEGEGWKKLRNLPSLWSRR